MSLAYCVVQSSFDDPHVIPFVDTICKGHAHSVESGFARTSQPTATANYTSIKTATIFSHCRSRYGNNTKHFLASYEDDDEERKISGKLLLLQWKPKKPFFCMFGSYFLDSFTILFCVLSYWGFQEYPEYKSFDSRSDCVVMSDHP